MSVSTPSPWPTGWRPTMGLSAGPHWKLARHCSLAPRQLLWVFVLLSMLSLTVAVFFWLVGAPWVMPFACLELLALGVAFVVYARHAGDAEWIALQGEQLRVARCQAGRWTYWQASRWTVRVGLSQNGLVELRAAGQCLELGALVNTAQRGQLVQALRQALTT